VRYNVPTNKDRNNRNAKASSMKKIKHPQQQRARNGFKPKQNKGTHNKETFLCMSRRNTFLRVG
jgi:hypothetical protein